MSELCGVSRWGRGGKPPSFHPHTEAYRFPGPTQGTKC